MRSSQPKFWKRTLIFSFSGNSIVKNNGFNTILEKLEEGVEVSNCS